MEDGDDSHTKVICNLNTDNNASILPNMANYPDIKITVIKNKNTTETTTNKVNGESDSKDDGKTDSSSEKEDSTDDDALVIDEEYKTSKTKSTINRKRLLSPSSRSSFKGFKKRMLRKSTEVLKIVNDCISATESVDGEIITSEDNCDILDEKISQGESLNVDSQDALTKNVKINTEIPIKEDSDTPTLITSPLNELFEAHTQNTNVVPESENNTNSQENNELLNKDCNNLVTNPEENLQNLSKNVTNKLKSKKIPSPKLTEYAQYLGLQPTVKFKCYKCSESSFPSMNSLNEHQQLCLGQPTKENPVVHQTSNSTSTNFRVTRKVYLCSACGTYYENWNLFLHMREVHRRFICLYCLGMFSFVEKLTQHLISKHNCSPTSYLSAEEYLDSYKDSCFLMCCHCENVFTEQDNFFEHACTERSTYSEKSCWSCGIKGTNPHLVSCKASIEQPKTTKTKKPDEMLENNMDYLTEPSTSIQKSKVKTKKSTKKTFSNVEHITADSPSNNKLEKTCDIANLCTVDMEPTIKSEPGSPENSPRDDSPSGNLNEEQETQESQNEPENSNNKNINTSESNMDEANTNSPRNECTDEKENPDNEEIDKNDISSETDTQNEDCQNETEEKQSENVQDNENSDTDIETENISTEENTTEKEKNIDIQNENSMEETQNCIPMETNSNETITKNINENSLESPQSDSDRNLSVSEPEMETETTEPEIRRVPKVTLKLPPPGTFSDNDSEDSEKLTMEVDENDETDQDLEESQEKETSEKPLNGYDNDKNDSLESDDGFQVAGDEVPILELQLNQPLDKFTTEDLLKICLSATIPTCIYCNHARKIAVNGKNLGLHAIAEHRFAATVNSITAEELIPNSFVLRIKEGLKDVEEKYFNLDLNKEPIERNEITFKREYECFQCRYITSIHKELYLHNRKMHAKTILLCIMCKSNFYSYSELLCHLCPGDYILNSEMKFNCCICSLPDLPSAFRLMVHLRKRHHTCDVCLEGCQNQSRLSNHVWKHKLHHLCYRCGIAYRNKPDITKHLFWKHGTESVLCKKCLQKKWPHVYHFCIPPTAFVCEECNLSFSRAVYLKVHKRLHIGEKKHYCTEENCTQGFVSKKLQLKHEKRHREPEVVPEKPIELVNGDLNLENIPTKPESLDKDTSEAIKDNNQDKSTEDKDDSKKNIIDVYDLPALNLSESDSSDSEEEKPKLTEQIEEKLEDTNPEDKPNIEPLKTTTETNSEEPKSVEIVDGIWENFKQYQATIEKRDSFNLETKDENSKDEDNKMEEMKGDTEKSEIKEPLSEVQQEIVPDLAVIMVDHDYCRQSDKKPENKKDDSVDHDYCNTDKPKKESKSAESKKNKVKKKTTSSSDSSSDSDSSSCTCGSNCSCSSSSGSSSSSSSSTDSDSSTSAGKRRIAARRERRKERAKRKKESETSQAASNNSVDVVATEDNAKPPIFELPIEESDLETDETETDEDFYDEHPQRLVNKMLEEKRNQLLLLAGATPPITNGNIIENSRPSTPSIPEEVPPKKRVKSKKRKKKSRSTPKREIPQNIPYQNHQSPLSIQPSTPILPHIHPIATPIPRIMPEHPKTSTGSGSETDSNVRASKRRRVPNKFYGYSSDEESSEKPPAPPILKWRKADLPTPISQMSTPKIVPPITIKNIPSPAPIIEPIHAPVVHHSEVRDSDSENEVPVRKSSSESSDSNRNEDSDSDGQLHISNCQPQFSNPQIQRNENLYCYCQCPYDEVSEMIACDGRDCAIEWFHFECVGIMVPPKGKWYCPDCRKKAAMRSDFIQT